MRTILQSICMITWALILLQIFYKTLHFANNFTISIMVQHSNTYLQTLNTIVWYCLMLVYANSRLYQTYTFDLKIQVWWWWRRKYSRSHLEHDDRDAISAANLFSTSSMKFVFLLLLFQNVHAWTSKVCGRMMIEKQ